jgi:hypothetical protein
LVTLSAGYATTKPFYSPINFNTMKQYYHEEPLVRMAYSSIFVFFDAYDLSQGLQLTEALVNTKHWKNEAGNFLFFVRQLEELCMAALAIHYESGDCTEAILRIPGNGIPDTSRTIDYVNPRYMGNAWDCFPRHLNSKQYHNPYKVFKQFSAAMQEIEWKRALRLLLEYALSKDSIEGAYQLYELLRMRKRLLQVVETCHLVLVRTMSDHKEKASAK